MNEIKLKVLDVNGHTLATTKAGPSAILVHTAQYNEGDRICLEATKGGFFCEIRLDDSMLPALVYVKEKTADFYVPFGAGRISYSPKSFAGERHLITARLAEKTEIYARRNLALNPYDYNGEIGMYPHASANIETRGEAVFAARNTIDGIFANASHGEYPYQSWGINRRADAELKLEFGVPVTLDELRLTLRADFPHDNYWTQATVAFSDGSSETLSLQKSEYPQAVSIVPRTVEWLVVKDLIQSSEPSPFPALSQLEAYGVVAEK